MSQAVALQETHERTRYDEPLLQRANAYRRDHGLSIAKFADLIDYSGATLSKYFSRDYVNSREIEVHLRNFFAREDRKATGSRFSPLMEDSMRVLEACEYALMEREMVVVYGNSQAGKSAGVEEFIRRKKDTGNRQIINVIVDSLTTPASLMRRIAEHLQLPPKTAADQLQEIVGVLNGGQYVIVLDDAGYLNVRACQALYRIMESGGCGVVLVGIGTALERIMSPAGRDAEDLLQFTSRCVRHVRLTNCASKEALEDVARRMDHFPGEKVLAAVIPEVTTARELKSMLKRVRWLIKLHPEKPLATLVGDAKREVLRRAA
jgi:DNA transposition AAA+ family ATPase